MRNIAKGYNFRHTQKRLKRKRLHEDGNIKNSECGAVQVQTIDLPLVENKTDSKESLSKSLMATANTDGKVIELICETVHY